jgi:lysophospholipase L1-like esterase
MRNKIKSILCYGDSNTWGYVAGSGDFETFYMERFPRDKRWTGLLQKKLGSNYYLIEEGLNGRTTNIDYQEIAGRNGKTHLEPCLYSHAPLDLVILFLGGNDLKAEFNRSTSDIVNGLSELIDIIKNSKYGSGMQSSPDILLIGYPIISNETYQDAKGNYTFKDAIVRSKQFSHQFKQLAEERNCYYLDASPYITLSEIDGIHFDETAHRCFADLIFDKIENIMNTSK